MLVFNPHRQAVPGVIASKRFSRARAKVGRRDLRWHDLRHTEAMSVLTALTRASTLRSRAASNGTQFMFYFISRRSKKGNFVKKILVSAAFAVAILTGIAAPAAPAYAHSGNIYTCFAIAKDGSQMSWEFNRTQEQAQQFKKAWSALGHKATCVKVRN